MALSAYFVEDPITRIVSITLEPHGGGTVVMDQTVATFNVTGERYLGTPSTTTPPQEWRNVGAMYSKFCCQSFAMVPQSSDPEDTLPTYLLGTFGPVNETDAASEIHYSNDGVTWEIVFHSTPHFSTDLTGLVWHPDRRCFYAYSHSVVADSDTSSHIEVRILKSSDGRSWSVDQYWATASGDYDATFPLLDMTTDIFKALCIKPENKGGVPDGLYGYDKAKKVLIGPQGLTWHGYTHVNTDDSGIFIETDGSATGGGAGLPAGVKGVSYSSGMWNAVTIEPAEGFSNGPVYVFASSNDGKDWAQVFSTAGLRIGGIISGPPPPPEEPVTP